MNRKLKGTLLTIAGGTCWGLSGSIGQYLFTYEGMDSKWLVPIRLGLAGIILLVYSSMRYHKRTYQPWLERKDRISLLVYGLLGVSFCQFFYFLTIQLSNAGIGTILQSVSPVMILAVCCFLEKRIPKGKEIISIILALLGVFLITTHGRFDTLSIPVTALFTGLMAAVCVTIYNVVPKNLLKKYPVVILQGWAFLLGSILFLFLFQPWKYHYVPSFIGFLGILGVVLIGNVLAFTWYMSGVALIGPEKGILYGFSEPVSAALITVLFMGSPFTIYDLLGFIMIFITLILISDSSSKA